jgi:hypothetical protein
MGVEVFGEINKESSGPTIVKKNGSRGNLDGWERSQKKGHRCQIK